MPLHHREPLAVSRPDTGVHRNVADLRDGLTGLPAAASLHALVAPVLAQAAEARGTLTLAIVDIDGFRALLTQHGFERGDRALLALAKAARALTRTSDVLARTGADELTVVFADQGPGAARRFATRLADAVAGHQPGLRLSSGLARREPGDDLDELLALAYAGLDLARARGGGTIADAPPRGTQRHDARGTRAIEALAGALSTRDHYRAEDSRVTADLARSLADELGLAPVDGDRIVAAVMLRHIGKVIVPDDVLNKPGALSEEEWALVRQHPLVGERLLRAVPGMDAVATIVRHQHEHWNGTGYPDGLEGALIPLPSRIVHAVDAWGALRNNRPYRPARSHGAAIHELTASAGRQLDPRVTESLLAQLFWSARGR